jgi:hypothetical protein
MGDIPPLPSTVSPHESLARYLTQSNHFRPQDHSVKPKAFAPPPDLRLSVFRIDGLTIEAVWEIGQANVVDRMSEPRNLHGIADVKASAIRDVDLQIDPDNVPPRHACIVGWPEDKSKQILIQLELAAKAKLVLRTQAVSQLPF